MIDPWKLFLAGGLFGLILVSILTIVVLRRLAPILQSKRVQSLRDQHFEPISRFGGIGMMGGFLGAILFLLVLPIDERSEALGSLPSGRFLGFIVGGIIAWAIGFCDDLWNLKAHWKLLGQIGLGTFAVSFGFQLDQVQGPFFQSLNLGLWSAPLTILWVIGVINAMNLIDGLDGLASGITLIALTILGWILIEKGDMPLLLVVITLWGAVFSFWTFNRPPASIFMGDSGSYFLGYSLAILTLWGTESSGTKTLLPILILAVPIIDTIFAIFRRLVKGIPFYSADKDHIHHRLLSKGFSSTAAMVSLLVISGVFGLLAILAFYRPELQGFAYLGGLALAWILLYILEYEVIRMPVRSIRKQVDHRSKRTLLIALSDQMDDFLKKDLDATTVFHSFKYWCDLAGISQYKLMYHGNEYYKNQLFEDSLRIIIYKINKWEIHFGLPRESWSIDSDLKGDLMEKVSNALVRRLEQLESSNVIELKQGIDSATSGSADLRGE